MSNTKVYLDCPEYVVELENEQGRLFVHLKVYKWGPSVLKELKEVLNGLKAKAAKIGYEYLHTYTRNPKFCKMLGGSFTMKFRDYEVYSWELR